jgi:hypothetical protein
MKQFTIKITGSGTLKEIESALRSVASEIRTARIAKPSGILYAPTVEWEDPTLMTVISEEE